MSTQGLQAGEAGGGRSEDGRALFNYYCYQCHAYAGNGATVAAAYLNPKPRDFTRADPRVLTRSRMLSAVRHGRAGTAMQSFARVLNERQSEAVVDYVRSELMSGAGAGLRYHTEANGWRGHDRYASAFPFATGELAIDADPETLSGDARAGRRLFVSACMSCHEGRSLEQDPLRWEPHAVSYPRSVDTCIDCHNGRPEELLPISLARRHPVTGASGADAAQGVVRTAWSPYARQAAPRHAALSALEEKGRTLFLANCAFCHGADGSARNWIGSFLVPRPRDLRQTAFAPTILPSRLRAVIRDGIGGTSMPAWRAVLSETQIEALIAYLAAGQRKAPAQTGAASPSGVPAASTVLRWRRTE